MEGDQIQAQIAQVSVIITSTQTVLLIWQSAEAMQDSIAYDECISFLFSKAEPGFFVRLCTYWLLV